MGAAKQIWDGLGRPSEVKRAQENPARSSGRNASRKPGHYAVLAGSAKPAKGTSCSMTLGGSAIGHW